MNPFGSNNLSRIIAVSGVSLPPFWFGIILQLLFFKYLGVLSLSDRASTIVLPAITLAAYPVGLITRQVRSMMVEVLQENYIRTAHAYGLSPQRIYFKYALKNTIAPALITVGLSFAYTLVGAFLVELIFNWPGLGRYAANSILSMDYPAVCGVTIVAATAYVFINLIVDLIQVYLDPRITL